MPSRTHICNLALIEIGEPPISDIDDVTTPAARCKLVFDDYVDEVCVSKYWSKIKTRIELALLPDPPLYGYNFQFQLPTDVLQVVSINDTPTGPPFTNIERYVIEDNKLLIDRTSVFITYTQKQSNPELWGQFLERAIVLRIAAGLAFIFTGSRTLAQDLHSLYTSYSRKSSGMDSNQGSRRVIRATNLTRVR